MTTTNGSSKKKKELSFDDKIKGVVTKNEEIIREIGEEVVTNDEPACEVGVSLGKTISLGAGTYEFIRLDVHLKIVTSPDRVVEGYEATRKLARALYAKEVKAVEATIKKK